VKDTDQQTFVLVHGTSHGGWCWIRVAERLRANNHRVFTPTLTGCGERSHLMSPNIDLDTHITDVVNVIEWEELTNIVLCGHSYGGWVVSGVAERIENRIGSIVFLDAFMPVDGERGIDTQSKGSREAVLAAQARGEVSRPAGSTTKYGLSGADLAWADSKITPQPIGVSLQPIKLTGARDRISKKSFILATGYNNPPFVNSYESCKQDPTWRVFDVPCHHDVMIEMPEALTEILLEVA